MKQHQTYNTTTLVRLEPKNSYNATRRNQPATDIDSIGDAILISAVQEHSKQIIEGTLEPDTKAFKQISFALYKDFLDNFFLGNSNFISKCGELVSRLIFAYTQLYSANKSKVAFEFIQRFTVLQDYYEWYCQQTVLFEELQERDIYLLLGIAAEESIKVPDDSNIREVLDTLASRELVSIRYLGDYTVRLTTHGRKLYSKFTAYNRNNSLFYYAENTQSTLPYRTYVEPTPIYYGKKVL